MSITVPLAKAYRVTKPEAEMQGGMLCHSWGSGQDMDDRGVKNSEQ